MWKITIRTPEEEPREHTLQPGITKIGRSESNDIVLDISSASRHHAEISYDADKNTIRIKDLGSTNGTFLNRKTLEKTQTIKDKDLIRIGTSLMTFVFSPSTDELPVEAQETVLHPMTQDEILAAFSMNPTLLFDLTNQLNSLSHPEEVVARAIEIAKQALRADVCKMILNEALDDLVIEVLPDGMIEKAIEEQSLILLLEDTEKTDKVDIAGDKPIINSALCLPILRADRSTIGILAIYNTRAEAKSFTDLDIQQALVIGHITGLAIERSDVSFQMQRQAVLRANIRALGLPSADHEVAKNFIQHGQLPEFSHLDATVLITAFEGAVALAENLGPQLFGRFLSEFNQTISAIIFKHGGFIYHQTTNGIQAIFGLTERGISPEITAVETALEISNTITKSPALSSDQLKIGIGINSGPVLAGYIRMGDDHTLSVLGDTIGVAEKLEKIARPGRILMGPITQAAVGTDFQTQREDDLEIPGRVSSIQVFQLITESAWGN